MLTAAPAGGLGGRRSKEAALLMRDAPEDLYAAAFARLSEEQKRLVINTDRRTYHYHMERWRSASPLGAPRLIWGPRSGKTHHGLPAGSAA